MAIVAALVPTRRSDAGSGTLLEQVEWNVGPYQLHEIIAETPAHPQSQS
jgi:hypothetical protein